MARYRGVAALLGVVLLAVLFTVGQRFGEDRQPADTIGDRSGVIDRNEPATVAYADLPAQAQRVVRAIEAGGPFRFDRDGITFGNRERLLPAQPRGWYREYTVAQPGSSDRGPVRIVAGQDGLLFYSTDHYRSFRQIVEVP